MVDQGLPGLYIQATDQAISRYNSLYLDLKFTRVSSNPDITVRRFYELSGAYAFTGVDRNQITTGVPSTSGNPSGCKRKHLSIWSEQWPA
jgi:hypothetical protein